MKFAAKIIKSTKFCLLLYLCAFKTTIHEEILPGFDDDVLECHGDGTKGMDGAVCTEYTH